jgi:hypothetical protein
MLLSLRLRPGAKVAVSKLHDRVTLAAGEVMVVTGCAIAKAGGVPVVQTIHHSTVGECIERAVDGSETKRRMIGPEALMERLGGYVVSLAHHRFEHD